MKRKLGVWLVLALVGAALSASATTYWVEADTSGATVSWGVHSTGHSVGPAEVEAQDEFWETQAPTQGPWETFAREGGLDSEGVFQDCVTNGTRCIVSVPSSDP